MTRVYKTTVKRQIRDAETGKIPFRKYSFCIASVLRQGTFFFVNPRRSLDQFQPPPVNHSFFNETVEFYRGYVQKRHSSRLCVANPAWKTLENDLILPWKEAAEKFDDERGTCDIYPVIHGRWIAFALPFEERPQLAKRFEIVFYSPLDKVACSMLVTHYGIHLYTRTRVRVKNKQRDRIYTYARDVCMYIHIWTHTDARLCVYYITWFI